MKNTISINDIKKYESCIAGVDAAIKVCHENNIADDQQVNWDDAVNLSKLTNNQTFTTWLIKNKHLLLEYTEKTFSCYVFNGIEYPSKNTLIDAINLYKAERNQYHKSLTSVVFSRSTDECAAWEAVDIDTFSIPDGVVSYHFHVFNHKTGLHSEELTLDDCRAKVAFLINSFVEEDMAICPISKKFLYSEDALHTSFENLKLSDLFVVEKAVAT